MTKCNDDQKKINYKSVFLFLSLLSACCYGYHNTRVHFKNNN